MQTNNDIFVNPSVIKTKIAGKLVDDTEQISGKTKLLGVKREQNPLITKVIKRTKSSNFGLYLRFWLCDVIHKWRNKWSESKPELKRIYWYQFYFDPKSTTQATPSYVRSMTVVKNADLRYLGP